MAVRLEKEFTLRLYYYTYQAWRSLHKALGGPWTEFRSFYAENTAKELQALHGDLHKRTTARKQPGTMLARLRDRCLPRRWKKWCVFHYLGSLLSGFCAGKFHGSAWPPRNATRSRLPDCSPHGLDGLLIDPRTAVWRERIDRRAGANRTLLPYRLGPAVAYRRSTPEKRRRSGPVALQTHGAR
jgi:hypothetical protein